MNREMRSKIAVKEELRPVVQAPSAVNGPTVDTRGYDSALAVLSIGAIVGAGVLATKVQHGSLADGSDAVDVPAAELVGAFLAVALTNSVEYVAYRGGNRYLRLVATESGGATSVANGASWVLGSPSISPTE